MKNGGGRGGKGNVIEKREKVGRALLRRTLQIQN